MSHLEVGDWVHLHYDFIFNEFCGGPLCVFAIDPDNNDCLHVGPSVDRVFLVCEDAIAERVEESTPQMRQYIAENYSFNSSPKRIKKKKKHTQRERRAKAFAAGHGPP
jgi:hypothetical protein